jgi:hypothetical protein
MLPISIKRPSATLTGFKTEVFKKLEKIKREHIIIDIQQFIEDKNVVNSFIDNWKFIPSIKIVINIVRPGEL